MMRVPRAEMLNVWMLFLNFAENLFLMLSVLKEHNRRPSGIAASLNDARYFDGELAAALPVGANNTAPSFIVIEKIALVENCRERRLWKNNMNVVAAMKSH